MLKHENTIFTLVDVQQKLTAVMHNRQELVANLVKLVKGLRLLNIPVIWMEQLPAKMGPTIPELTQLLQDSTPIEKSSFSCYGSEDYIQTLKKSRCSHVILAGIETHVCIYQTAVELIHNGYTVEVVVDATSSRNPSDKTTAIEKITHPSISGMATRTTTEMLLFELMSTADHPAFRDILKIVK